MKRIITIQRAVAWGTCLLLSCFVALNVSAAPFKPGTYAGEATGRNGGVKVEVAVDDSKILSVKVVEHKESAGVSDAAIRQVPEKIVAGQSLAVDGISGATLTSNAILNAAKQALSQATPDLSPLLAKKAVAVPGAVKSRETDVVIVGAGAAGMTAAIAVAERGKGVILVEKQGMLGGGDSMLISTGVTAGGSKLIKELGIKNASNEDYYQLLLKQAADKKMPIDKESVRTYAMRGGELVDWLMDIGVPFGRFQEDKYFHIIKDGSAPGPWIIGALSRQFDRYKIDYRLNTRATAIVMDNGKAAGIEVEGPEGKYTIKARAVVMATGGFSASRELLAKYSPTWLNRPTTGASSLTGDGILMAEKVGAGIYNMDQVKANYLCHVLPSGDGVSLTAITPYTVLVNHEGKRFVNEDHPSINHKSEEMMKQKGHEAYAVIDQKAIDALKLMKGYYDAGYFVAADSLDGLAGKIDVDKKAFLETMRGYEGAAAAGKDEAFGRKIKYPVDKKLFYASLVTPSMQSTYGGIRVDTQARALDKNGKVIPGLYAAGATSGHDAFANEVGFASIIALVYGRIAGETAVAEIK